MDYFIEDMAKYTGKPSFCILIDGKKKYGKDMMAVILLSIICYLITKKNIDGSHITLPHFIVVNKHFVTIRAPSEWSPY